MAATLNSYLHIASLLGSIGVAIMVLFVRLRASAKPMTVMKIIMPPIGMSTGFLMFVAPIMRIPWIWAAAAFMVGVICFSYPLIRTSRFVQQDSGIYLLRSKAFVWILLLLLVIRLVLHQYVEKYITIYQTGAVFFILAFGMLLPWRIWMYREFRLLQKKI
jgi:membrane protein CcdC involved in cytochrome C biogenesis